MNIGVSGLSLKKKAQEFAQQCGIANLAENITNFLKKAGFIQGASTCTTMWIWWWDTWSMGWNFRELWIL